MGSRPFEFGVEYRGCRGQLVVGHMVVADDEVDSALLGILYLVDSLYAAVEDYYKRHSLFGEHVDTL